MKSSRVKRLSLLGRYEKVGSRLVYGQGVSDTVNRDGILTLALVLYRGETSQFF
jgi:hypothetical protein